MTVRAALFLLAAAIAGEVAGQSVTWRSLLAEAGDLAHLARLPSAPYTAHQAASYSGYPFTFSPDSAAWHRNDDYGWFLGLDPGPRRVMVDIAGPGVIERIWSANPLLDSLSIYIDGADEPAWSASMYGLLGGFRVLAPPLAGEYGHGHSMFFPVPFARQCKITVADLSAGELYWHVGYRTYGQSTEMPSFAPESLAAVQAAVETARAHLADTASWTAPQAFDRVDTFTLAPGATHLIALDGGPTAIVDLRFKVRARMLAALLRGTALSITWDNAQQPQVDVPLGDFFAGSPHVSPYRTLPVAILPDSTLACRWVMPFRDRAELLLHNRSAESGWLAASVRTGSFTWDDSSLYFHAYWRQDTAVHTVSQPEGAWYMVFPPADHRFVRISGTGMYVGTVLQVHNQGLDWWGEGDERIWVDGEAFPSFMGTGTEDYFGYAFSVTQFFQHPYMAQPHSDGFHGYTTNVRWHVLDAIPFMGELTFDMEVQTAVSPTTLDYGRACFFYARPGALTDHDGLDGEDLFLRSNLTSVRQAPPPARPDGAASGAVILYDLRGRVLNTGTGGSGSMVVVLTGSSRMSTAQHNKLIIK